MSVIKSSRDGAVATVTIDRPAEGNMLTVDGVRELAAAFRAAGASDAKVIVLRGNGADFCRGRDPKGAAPSPTAMTNTRQPIVGVVQGAVHGFGSAIAGVCDVTIAHDSARFRLPEMEYNLPPTLAVSALLPRVPRKGLAWMVYSI